MASKIVENLRRRAIKTFMDMLILAELQDKPLSGYDIIGLIHKRFNVLVSSGTVYSLLYSLERQGLVTADMENRKRVYTLTERRTNPRNCRAGKRGNSRSCAKSDIRQQRDNRLNNVH